MAELEPTYTLSGNCEIAEARLVHPKSGVEMMSLHHEATRGIIHTVGMQWRTANIGLRSYVAEEYEVLSRFQSDKTTIALSHIPWKKDKQKPNPREFDVVDGFSYAEIRRFFGGRQPSWLNFYNHGSMDLFWVGGVAHRAESLAVNLPFADEAMLKHGMDMITRTTRFGHVLTETLCLEMLDESRKMLETSLASLAVANF